MKIATFLLKILLALTCITSYSHATKCADINDDLIGILSTGLKKSQIDDAFKRGASTKDDFLQWKNFIDGGGAKLDLDKTELLDFKSLLKFADIKRAVKIDDSGNAVVVYASKQKKVGESVTIINKSEKGITDTKKGFTVKRNEYGFPIFNSKFDTFVPDSMLGNHNRGKHFKYANERVRELLEKNPSMAKEMGLTEDQIKFFKKNSASADSPEGLTWHHHQDTGRMQLIDSVEHDAFRHTGGHSIWGGGKPPEL